MSRLSRVPSFLLSLALVGASLAVALALPTPSHAAPIPKAYPVRDFFANPEKAYFRLSEDGKTLGFMQPVSVDGGPRRLNVFVQALKGSQPVGQARRLTADGYPAQQSHIRRRATSTSIPGRAATASCMSRTSAATRTSTSCRSTWPAARSPT